MREIVEAFSGEGGKHLALVLFFAITGVIVIGVTFINRWYRHRQLEMEAALKQEMVQRGMSAEEIERVLAAGASSGKDSCGSKTRNQ